jgi:hypothetical protein
MRKIVAAAVAALPIAARIRQESAKNPPSRSRHPYLRKRPAQCHHANVKAHTRKGRIS